MRDWHWGQKEQFEPKKILASAGLLWPRGCWRVLTRPDTGTEHQGSTLRSKINVWAKNKFRPRSAFGSLEAAGGFLRGPDTVNEHQGSTLRSKGNVWAKKILASAGLWWPRGRWRARRPSGTIRDRHWGQKESFEPKKNLASAGLRRPLEATWGRNLGLPSYFWASLDLSFP